jgi:DivIVA domain-containing protein
MPLSPEQVAGKRFSTRSPGYDKGEVKAFLAKASADYSLAIHAIAETRKELEASQLSHLVEALHSSVRTLLLAAELQGRSSDANAVDDPQPMDVLDEAAKLLIAAADAMEVGRNMAQQVRGCTDPPVRGGERQREQSPEQAEKPELAADPKGRRQGRKLAD